MLFSFYNRDLQSSLELLHKRYSEEQTQLNELLREQEQAKLQLQQNSRPEKGSDANDDTLVDTGAEDRGMKIQSKGFKKKPESGRFEEERVPVSDRLETGRRRGGAKQSSGEGSQPSDALHIEDLELDGVTLNKVIHFL